MTIIDALLGEHGAIYALLDHLEAALDGLQDLRLVQEQTALLAAALASHAAVEDALLFEPALDAGGAPTFQVMEQEHRGIEALIEQAGHAHDLDTARSALQDAMSLARDHFAREEHMAFPMARDALGREALTELGRSWAERRHVSLD